jgi:ubiquinone/menaquinone biosynthesis C-methylase UbiE
MINFDRVAEIYDETRGLPDDVLEQITQAMVNALHATPSTRFLELGVGTGRIALPMLRFGFPYTGIDISIAMMNRLKVKAPADAGNLTLVTGDITDLPFGESAFDVVLAVHVFHLIPQWKQALTEARRVLSPDGALVLAGNEHGPGAPAAEIRHAWSEIVRELGAPEHPPYGESEEVETWLIDAGASIAEYRAAQWESQIVPAELIERIRRKDFSRSWDIPEDIMTEANSRLTTWATERYGDLAQPLPSEERFDFRVARWQDA